MLPSLSDLLQRNGATLSSHQPITTIAELESSGKGLPKVCIVSCVDPRIIPEQIFGLDRGEAFVFRTIAGHPQLVVNDLIGLDMVFKGFEDIVIVHHTDCGACRFPVDEMREDLATVYPSAKEHIEKMTFGKISTSLEDNLREDVKWLKEHPLVRERLSQAVKGYMFDIKTGEVHQIV